MNWDLLLYYMSHRGRGSWDHFRDVIAELAPQSSDPDRLSYPLAARLSDLCHADFFLDGSSKWEMCAPVLAGLPPPRRCAVLCGGRSPSTVRVLERAAAATGAGFQQIPLSHAPTKILVEGDDALLSETARAAGISFLKNAPECLSLTLTSIPDAYGRAPEAEPPNWPVRVFDPSLRQWAPGRSSRGVCEYRSRYGALRFFVHRRRHRPREMSKREAMYADAWLRGTKVLEYDPAIRHLSAFASLPLPDLYARAACLCSGVPAEIRSGRLVYGDVPPRIAYALIVLVGQRHPGFDHLPLQPSEPIHERPIQDV